MRIKTTVEVNEAKSDSEYVYIVRVMNEKKHMLATFAFTHNRPLNKKELTAMARNADNMYKGFATNTAREIMKSIAESNL